MRIFKLIIKKIKSKLFPIRNCKYCQNYYQCLIPKFLESCNKYKELK
jgi:transcription elongation factor Elf1